MTRPRYETPKCLAREAAVADELRRNWGCDVKKLAPQDTFDYELMWPSQKYTVEIKTRTTPFASYPTYLISQAKVDAAALSPTVLLVVKFTDGIWWTPFSSPHTSSVGGRRDRGDPFDVEAVALYPKCYFKPISVSPHDDARGQSQSQDTQTAQNARA